MQLGQLRKSARKHRRLTQTDVAGRLGLSQNRVSYLESHPNKLSFEQLLAWCAVVGLELRLGGRDAAKPPNPAEW